MNALDILAEYREDLWKALGNRFHVSPWDAKSAEVYLSGFATVQVSVSDDGAVTVERYYDSELVNDRLAAHHEYPIRWPAQVPPITEVVTLAHKWLASIRGDESIFGGIDD